MIGALELGLGLGDAAPSRAAGPQETVALDLGAISTWVATNGIASGNILTATEYPSLRSVYVRKAVVLSGPGSYEVVFDLDALTNLDPFQVVRVQVNSMSTASVPLVAQFDFANGTVKTSDSVSTMTPNGTGGYTCRMALVLGADVDGTLDIGMNETEFNVFRLSAPAGNESMTITNARIVTAG